MSVENLYSYLEYLNLAIDQLDETVAANELETAGLKQQLEFTDLALLDARREIDRLNAQLQVNAQQAEAQVKKMEAQLKMQAQNASKAKAAPPQTDLFGTWTTPAAPAAPAEAASVKTPAKAGIANDQNALILAKKLDSTIDKVQRLIGQGK